MNQAFVAFVIGLFCLFHSARALAAPGDLDASFGTGGKVSIALGGGNDTAQAAARQTDGKLVVVGSSVNIGERNVSLVRYNANGTLDPSFGSAGKVLLTTIEGGANAVAILSDRKILVAGYGFFDSTNTGFLVAKLNENGTLDTSFGTQGVARTDFGSRDDRAHALLVLADGKILLAGHSTIDSGGDAGTQQVSMVRYNSAGGLDNAFGGGDGKMVVLGFGGIFYNGRATALGLQGSKIYVAAAGSHTNSTPVGALIRANLDGSLDTAWGPFANNFPAGQGGGLFLEDNTAAYALAFFSPNPDENTILLAGEAGQTGAQAMRVWNFNVADGSPSSVFGSAGKFTIETAPSSGRAIGFSRNVGVVNRIIIGGNVGDDFAAVRLFVGGTLDTAFGGGDGIASADLESASVDTANAMLIQPDNRIVLAGSAGGVSDSDYGVVRFNSGGTLDTGFSGDGRRLDDVGFGSIGASAVAIQPDGKIVVAGGPLVARFEASGALDLSFDEDGVAKSGLTSGRALALQPDGKVVVAGTLSPSLFAAGRLNADGTRDLSFSEDGRAVADIATTVFNPNNNTSRRLFSDATAVGIQSDGSIVLAGYSDRGGSSPLSPPRYEFNTVRFDANGARDTAFAGDGLAEAFQGNPGSNGGLAHALIIQADDKIIVAGSAEIDFGLVRYHSNGALDSSFGNGGTLTTVFPGQGAFAYALAIRDARLVAAGVTFNDNKPDFALARYHVPDGSLDSTFDDDGRVITPGDDFGSARAVQVQADGKVLAAGDTDTTIDGDFALLRYNSDGSPDTSYGDGGKVIIDFLAGPDRLSALALDSAGHAVVAGNAGVLISSISYYNLFGLARVLGDAPPPPPTPTPTPSATPTPTPAPTASPTPPPARFANISTRLRVETGDNVLIGGFIVTGSAQKRIIVRALGPSLPPDVGPLANPLLELYDGDGNLLASNDNWQEAPNAQEIIDSTIPPPNELESAILGNVELGAYTAVVRDVADGQGVGLVEVYDLGNAQDSKLANIATRGRVLTGDDVMIGGLIVTGSSAQKVIVRAIGPSLGIAGQLENPMLELFDSNGNPLAANNNWKDTQQQEIEATTIPPSSELESAIVTMLPPAPYTAIVSGVNQTTGVALVEVYALD